MDYLKKSPLYVGVGAHNSGFVTTLQYNNTTKKFGYTVEYASAVPADNFVEIYIGVGARNNGIVSPDANYCNDATQSIGMLSIDSIENGQKLYVGIGVGNNGVVTPNEMHLGDATEFLGYALPL